MTTLKLPKPKISNVSAITIATPDLACSSEFYQRLGFKEIFRSDFPFPLIQLSDGALLIMLRKDKDPYIALTYYSKDPDNIAKELERSGIIFAQKPAKTDLIKKYLLKSRDGLDISIVTHADCFRQPTGPTMLTMSQADYFDPAKYANKVCGMFGELAHPVSNLQQSILFWEKLGFTVLSKFSTPYPWAIVSDGVAIIGLHQSTHFISPTITFFATDMEEKIENLKNAGLQNYAEKGGANILLTTPEGQHINFFRLGM